MVAYNGIKKQAIISSLKADLTQVKKKLDIAYNENGSYPKTINCAIQENQFNICIKGSQDNILMYLPAAKSTLPKNYTLIASNNSIDDAYFVSDKNTVEKWGWKKVSTGFATACAIAYDDKVYCWGRGSEGQMGNGGRKLQQTLPTPVDTSGVLDGKTITNISTGRDNSCVIDSDGLAYCWGANSKNSLGKTIASPNNIPDYLNGNGLIDGYHLKDISVGNEYTCAIISTGDAYCWGYNKNGQLGSGDILNKSLPNKVVGNHSYITLSTSVGWSSDEESHTCAININNLAYCWGYNADGRLGINSIVDKNVPTLVNGNGKIDGVGIKDISTGLNHTCAVNINGKAYCWGDNGDGQVSIGGTRMVSPTTSKKYLLPTIINSNGYIDNKENKYIYANDEYTCAISSDSIIYCWVKNSSGQLGRGDFNQKDDIAAVKLPGKVINMSNSSSGFNCAISSDNQVYCWGSNGNGRLGIGSLIKENIPKRVKLPIVGLDY